MKFAHVEHLDDFDYEILFWVDICDVCEALQDEARKIDGDQYSRDCFGICVNYDAKTERFYLVTETDPDTQEPRSVYYIDNDGDKHWFPAEITQDFCIETFTECLRALKGTESLSRPTVRQVFQSAEQEAARYLAIPEPEGPSLDWC